MPPVLATITHPLPDYRQYFRKLAPENSSQDQVGIISRGNRLQIICGIGDSKENNRRTAPRVVGSCVPHITLTRRIISYDILKLPAYAHCILLRTNFFRNQEKTLRTKYKSPNWVVSSISTARWYSNWSSTEIQMYEIIKANSDDLEALYEVCLRTGAAGQDGICLFYTLVTAFSNCTVPNIPLSFWRALCRAVRKTSWNDRICSSGMLLTVGTQEWLNGLIGFHWSLWLCTLGRRFQSILRDSHERMAAGSMSTLSCNWLVGLYEYGDFKI